jgi:hypothetical protein
MPKSSERLMLKPAIGAGGMTGTVNTIAPFKITGQPL